MDIDYKNQILTANSGNNNGLMELSSSRGLKIVTISPVLPGSSGSIKYESGVMSYFNGTNWIGLVDVGSALANKLDKHSSVQLGQGSFIPSKTSDYELGAFHVNMAPNGIYTTTYNGNKYLTINPSLVAEWISPLIQDSPSVTGGFVDFREPYVKFRRSITIAAPTTWTRAWNAGFSNAITVSGVGYPTGSTDATTNQYVTASTATMEGRTSSIVGIANSITDLHNQLAAKFNALSLPAENWKLVALQAAVRRF